MEAVGMQAGTLLGHLANVFGAQTAARPSEASVIAELKAGSEEAFASLIAQYHAPLYSLIARTIPDPCEAADITQDVFIKIYRTLNSFDTERGAFMTWVTTVTRNLLVDHFRKTKQDRMTDSLDAPVSEHEDAMPLSDQIQDRGPTPDSRAQSVEVSQTVHEALQKLSPDLREAVILRDLQDMDYRDIATVLKVPEGTVKSRINRGRAELARLLQRTYRQVM